MKWTSILVLGTGLWSFEAAFLGEETNPPSRAKRIAVRPGEREIERGDKVEVRVVVGGVLLRFEAEAVSAGHIGESVIVLNPENGRRFVALVEDKGKVIVKK